MKEVLFYIAITFLLFCLASFWLYWKSLKHYAKIMLDFPNPNNIIYLTIKEKRK